MKRFLTCLLILTIVMLCTACFDGGEDSTIKATQDSQAPTHSQETPTSGSANVPTEPSTEPIDSDEITLAETVIYDGHGVKITVKGMEEGWSGTELKVLIENGTDKNIAFSGNEYIVNGVTISGYAYIDVAAGKKTNDTITLSEDDLEAAGIDCIATIQGMDFHVYDSDSFEDMFDVSFALTTSIADEYMQEIDDSGDVLFEEAGVTIIAKSLRDDLFGHTVLLLVKNGSGKDITVNAENISVNGFTISGWLYDTVYADTVRFCEILLASSDLGENEIEKIETVTFTINIIDPATFDRIAESNEIGITVE